MPFVGLTNSQIAREYYVYMEMSVDGRHHLFLQEHAQKTCHLQWDETDETLYTLSSINLAPSVKMLS